MAVILVFHAGTQVVGEGPKPLPVTRADLATAYLRLDRLLQSYPPAKERIADINLAFDALTSDFFALRFGSAIEKIHRLEITARAGAAPTVDDRWLKSLKGRILPRVVAVGDVVHAKVQLSSLYPITEFANRTLKLRVRIQLEGAGIPVCENQVDGTVGKDGKLRLDLSIPSNPGLAAGKYDVLVGVGDVKSDPVDQWFVVNRPISAIRIENERRLKLLSSTANLRAAVTTCQARNRLLVESPSENNSAEFLANPIVLAKEVANEIARLEKGENPYAGQTGDHWRTIVVKQTEIPARIFVPEKLPNALASRSPLPLVIALHGAGGDENMFMDAYGAGMLKSLAAKHGFIAISPQTAYFAFAPNLVDGVVDALTADYEIDRKRVYVVGHSMGAGATAGISRRCTKTVAACCCLAGGGNFLAAGPMVPTLVIAAELDGLIPIKRLEPSVKKAIAAGRPIEYRSALGYGHTLMVGAFLPAAIEWLFARALQ